MNKRIYLMILVLLMVIGGVKAQTVDVYDITATPGAILVQVDMLNYSDVGAVSLYIDYDADLMSFTGITNTTLSGTWLSSATNGQIIITYTAPPLTGYPINGKLLDLKFDYNGGFTGTLDLTNDCEIANRYLSSIPSTFIDGSVTNDVSMSSLMGAVGFMSGTVGQIGEIIEWPLLIEGNNLISGAFSSINSITLNLSYDPLKLTYQNYDWNPAYPGVTITGGAGALSIVWTSIVPQDFSATQVLAYLKFVYNGVGDANLNFESGSMVASNFINQSTLFVDGVASEPIAPFEGTLTINSVGAAQGSSDVLVPVEANGFTATDIGAINLNITFDPAKLTYKGIVQNQQTGWIVNQAPAGTLNIVKTSTAGFAIADGALITLKFDYVADTQADITFMGGSSIQTNWFDNVDVGFTDGFISAVPYALTVTSNNVLFGSVTGSGNYLIGETVPITATPLTGYHFVNWTGTGAAYVADVNDPTTTVTMPAMAIGLTANFAGYSVSGKLKYASVDVRPITGSTVTLKLTLDNSTVSTTLTDVNGDYSFADVPDGSYYLEASTTKPWAGTDLFVDFDDLLDVYDFYFSGGISPLLTGVFFLAGDVNEIDGIDMDDVLDIYDAIALNLATPIWSAPSWIFESPSVIIVGSNVSMDINGICSGDVNASFNPIP